MRDPKASAIITVLKAAGWKDPSSNGAWRRAGVSGHVGLAEPSSEWPDTWFHYGVGATPDSMPAVYRCGHGANSLTLYLASLPLAPAKWNVVAHFWDDEKPHDPTTFDLDLESEQKCLTLVAVFSKHERFMGAFVHGPDGTVEHEFGESAVPASTGDRT